MMSVTNCEFGYMPYLSEDGSNNAYIASVSKYVGLNKKLEEEGNEQKLEDALHVMEVLCTVEGMRALSINTDSDVLFPLKEFVLCGGFHGKSEDRHRESPCKYCIAGWHTITEKDFPSCTEQTDSCIVLSFSPICKTPD